MYACTTLCRNLQLAANHSVPSNLRYLPLGGWTRPWGWLAGMGRGSAHFLAACNFYCSCDIGMLQVACCMLLLATCKFYRSCDAGFSSSARRGRAPKTREWKTWHQVRDVNGSSFVTHDPWPLHYFILHMGLHVGEGVAWLYWTTLSCCQSWEQTKWWIKIKPPAMMMGLIEWLNSFLRSTKNKKLHVTGHLFHHHGSMGHW